MKKLFNLLFAFSAVMLAASLAVSCGPQEDPEIAVASVSLSQSAVTLEVGGTSNLTATVQPSNATNKVVSWSTSNQSVATVNNGTVTAVAEGTATITATAGGESATCSVTVNKKVVAVTSIELDNAEVDIVSGSTITLKATVKPTDATDQKVTWESDNPEIATVDGSGKVNAIKEGVANITAKAGEKTATCVVTIRERPEVRIKAILMELYNALDGPNWTRQQNWGTDVQISEWAGVQIVNNYGNIVKFRLSFSGVGLKGEIPECIGDLVELTDLSIDDEPGLTGSLPDSFSKLINLKYLWLHNTSMTSLPDVFAPLTSLKYVYIGFNEKMTGPLPESLGYSDNIETFSIQHNKFTGELPASWGRLLKLKGSDMLRNNCLSGKIPDSFLQSEGEELAYDLMSFLVQSDGFGFDIADLDIPGYWPRGPITDFDGKTFYFKDVVKENKYTVYLSWAPWCPFSAVLLPMLLDYYNQYKQDGLEIIATVQGPEDNNWGEGERANESRVIKEKGYDVWYNFFFGPYGPNSDNYLFRGRVVPEAEVYDQNGNVLFSTMHNILDPIRDRFGTYEGDKNAFDELIPFLETLLGPAEAPDEYSSTDYSMDGKVLTLQKASVGKGIDIIFMGDAYTDRDMSSGGLYETVMKQAKDEFFAIEPYKTFRDRFNVYAVKVVSKNGRIGSGYTTTLGTNFGQGTKVFVDNDKAFEYAKKVPGNADNKNLLVCVMVNSRSRSGTAFLSESLQSSVAVTSTLGNQPELFGSTLRHEAGGHGFAFLEDEYVNYQVDAPQSMIDKYNSLYKSYGWYSNVDFTNDPSKVRWSAFLSDERYKDEVGIFEGGAQYATGVYRPSKNSMMRENMEYYNAPSRWAIYKRIMELSGETASFEKFLEYDAVNRGKQQSSAPRTRSAVEWEPTAPPVVVP